MRVLAIESSCDECAAAVVGPGPILLGQQVATQIPIHSPYGGVVPELASRDHIRKIVIVIEKALERAGLTLAQIDGYGVTAGPGLIGSLLIGVNAAKALSWSQGRPLVGVHHLEAHLHAIYLAEPDFAYPHLGLVVSGGHTSLIRVDGVSKLHLISRTLDDAAGEALDKVATLLGLAYPGGVSIQQAAEGGDPKSFRFPRPIPGKRLDFSFSGLKTAAAVRVKKEGLPVGPALCDFAASFQEAVVDVLVKKTIAAAQQENLKRILVAGGVAANLRLRQVMQSRAEKMDLEVRFPAPSLCTDNAAMVAALSAAYLTKGAPPADLCLDANAGLRWPDA